MLSDKILEKIKETRIAPKSRWKFLLKNYLVWASGILFLIIGSMSVAVIIYIVRNNDWDISSQITNSLAKFILITLPYFWIIFLIIFSVVIYFNFKQTKRGYKYPSYVIVLGVALISVVFGTMFYNVGLGQAIENVVSEKVPIYRNHLDLRAKVWDQPEKGLLRGVVEKVNEENLHIKNFEGKIWVIKNKLRKENFNFKKGEHLKILGEKINDENFDANDIRPFLKKRKNLIQRIKDKQLFLQKDVQIENEQINERKNNNLRINK
ncbi:MAG: hypothetical protein U9P90_03155 [Patescibacteria group bacterium]|nr:hypothetical protein [Patescibacteria group bacterium]